MMAGNARPGHKSGQEDDMDVYQIVTDRIVAQLEAGTVPWKQPWKTTASHAPQNLVSRRPYRGINVFLTLSGHYRSPFWATYKQVSDKGGHVRKGERATPIVFWKFLEHAKNRDDGTVKLERIPMLRYFSVFNADQCDDLPVPEIPDPDGQAVDIPSFLAGYLATGPSIRHSVSARACYHPGSDTVELPESAQFLSPEAYYATLYHELAHSTGHSARLARDLTHPFGSRPYAREELVAEMTSAFLCAETGIAPKTETNAVAYIASWIRTLKEDPRALVVSAGLAQKAAAMVSGSALAESEAVA